MAKTDWAALQAEFTRETMRTGIGAQEWCKKKGLNYSTAKRHIKGYTIKGDIKEALENAESVPRRAKNANGKVRKIVRSKKCAKKSAQPDDSQELDSAQVNSEIGSAETRTNPNTERNEKGWLLKGNQNAKGNRGNPNPVNLFQKGNTHSMKHGGYSRYSKYMDADDYFADAKEMSLTDELDVCRAMSISLVKTIGTLNEIISDPECDNEQRLEAIGRMLATQTALDRTLARIESNTRTLDQLWISSINGPRLKADTQRIIAATRKLELEAAKLSSDGADKSTPVSVMLEDIQKMGNSGLLN